MKNLFLFGLILILTFLLFVGCNNSPPNVEEEQGQEISLDVFNFGNETLGTYKGEMENELPHGQGEFESYEDEHGYIWSYNGEWEYGKFEGHGTYENWHTDSLHRTKRTGVWKNSQLNGEGTSLINNRTIYKGNYKDDMYHGEGTLYHDYTRQEIFSGVFNKNVPDETSFKNSCKKEPFNKIKQNLSYYIAMPLVFTGKIIENNDDLLKVLVDEKNQDAIWVNFSIYSNVKIDNLNPEDEEINVYGYIDNSLAYDLNSESGEHIPLIVAYFYD